MIFTTVIVPCLFALLGVFQSSMVDTLLSSFAHLNTPTLSSVTTILQVAGSIKRLALDAVRFPEVDLSLAQLSAPSIDNTFTNINITLQDFSIGSNTTLTPAVGATSQAGFWYSFVNLSIRAGLLFLSYRLFKLACSELFTLHTESDADCPLAKDQHNNGANSSEHEYLHAFALAHPHKPTSYYNPLSFVSPSPLQDSNFFPTPPQAFIPPATSLASHLGDAEHTCAFGVPRLFYASGTAEENDDDDDDYDKYPMDALNVPDHDASPAAGWCCEDEAPAARPDQDTLDAWVFPLIDPGEDPPGNLVGGDVNGG